MNPRERLLAIGVLSIVVALGLGFLAYQFYVVPLRERDESIATLKQEIGTKRDRIQQVLADKPRLERWKQLSLPADADLARREYEKYLSELLRLSKFQAGSYTVTSKPVDTRSSPTLPGKKEQPIYTRLSFTVMAHGDLASLVTLLDRFYHTGLLHEIKNLSIQRPVTSTGPSQQQQQVNGLDVNLTIEALIVQGAENRPNLLPGADRKLLAIHALTALQRGPAGLALVPVLAGPGGPLGPRVLASPPRQYASIPAKNIFFGVVKERQKEVDPTDVRQFVYLTDITHNEAKTEAWLFNRYARPGRNKTRLRATAGFDSFQIYDSQDEPVLKATVVRIDDRDVVFRVGEKFYSLHVGDNLQESMSHPLKADQVQSMGLSAP